jgi:hypothetical protein
MLVTPDGRRATTGPAERATLARPRESEENGALEAPSPSEIALPGFAELRVTRAGN